MATSDVTHAPGRPAGRSKRKGGQGKTAAVLLLPAVLVLALVLGYPLARLLGLSAQKFGPRELFTGTPEWTGLTNFTEIITDSVFWSSLARTALFAGLITVLLLALGMGVAHLLLGTSKPMRLVTTISLVLVWAMPMVTAALMWQWLFQPQYGVTNWLITQLRIFGDFTAHDWWMNPVEAFALIVILEVWKGLPFVSLTLYAGLSQIPASLYEAAAMDGASGWQTFKTMTWPMMRPILFLVTILEIIWSVNSFTPIWLLTQGGPNQGTMTLGVWSFVTAFSSNDYGQGAAVAVVTVLVLSGFTSLYIRRLVKGGEVS